MNSRRADPPPPRRPSGDPRPEASTRRVSGPPPPAEYRPPLAWSQEPDRRPRHRAPAPPPIDPRRTPPRSPQGQPPQQQRPPHGAAGAPGYAPRQEPQPVPGGRHAPAPQRPAGDEPRRRSDSPPPRPPKRGRRDASKPDDRRARPAAKRTRRKFRLGRILLVVLLLLLITPVAMLFYYDSKLHRVDALSSYAGRVADTPGTNWLIVGTDSRAGLTDQQKENLATGDADGARTDTIMMAHLPPSGKPMLISIPRDLYVPIPGMGSHKINAAFNNGGAKLLVQTVEEFSGVRIDHYVEIGFGGFDQLVEAVGGVEMCLDKPLRDPKAGLKLKAGCQTLNGAQALGLVRTRAFPNADLERVVNQRKFLAALMSRATSPAVLLNPFRVFPFVSGAVDAVTVDTGDHLWNLAWLAFKIKGDPITTTVPSDGDQATDDGDSLIPGTTTAQFFDHIARGQAVPEDLLSSGGGAFS
ncbi:LCP family protein [Gordonia sp. (in: high G+C Gram-positive bacteria)]|uniref:LCP family protein n=1 Tax=Gordonia sp. (in: high G+C Gram-positive bacteria) TaxID=84139 RepID=UPI0025C17400|nr:LCP family protein [Gordonia sp. (in: high G+C Gram-positive bacteria)]